METNFPTGYIIVVRGFLEWEWYEQPDVSRVMLHLMLKSNYTAKKWQGIEIGIGEFVTSTEKLSTALGISSFKIKNALKKLSDTGYIKIETTNKFTKIKLMESSVYQSKPFEKQKQTEQQTKIKPQSNQNQTTTTNKENKEKEIEESKNIFKSETFKFLNLFPQDHLESFFNYWCQENKQTGRLKFEEEKFWNLEYRIKNWKIFKSATNKKEPNNFYLNR